MAENQFAHRAFTPEAATDEPAFPFNLRPAVPAAAPGEPDGADDPDFATEEEAAAFYRGMAQGIRIAGREVAHPHMPADFSVDLARGGDAPSLLSAKPLEAWPLDEELLPAASAPRRPARAVRHDGWTGERQRVFLEALAACGVVSDACRRAGMGRDSAYALRQRAEGRAFALAWDAALLQSRRTLADDVLSRARHGVIERVYRGGEIVAERHRYDNRLTMAVLARLDRQAAGDGDGPSATARVIAGEWDQFLDIVEAGGAGAEAFLRARVASPPAKELDESPRAARAEARPGDARELESAASLLARLAAYKKWQAGLPEEIPTADLDPADMEGWTDEQFERAIFSGFLDRLGEERWPAAARAGEADGADGSRRLCRLYRERHAEPEEEEPAEEWEGEVWEDEPGAYLTNFPPPPGFDGWESGEPDEEDYSRTLSDAEFDALKPELDAALAETAAARALRAAARDSFFGFAPQAPEPATAPEPSGGAPSSLSPAGRGSG